MEQDKELMKVETTTLVLPGQLNHMNNMHGGEILKLMDNTAGIVCAKYSGGNAVTAAVNEFKFIKPVPAGSVIRCEASVLSVGHTSMNTLVTIYVDDVVNHTEYKAAEGFFVGVAIDSQGKPRPVQVSLEV